jgi:hypothetical protein
VLILFFDVLLPWVANNFCMGLSSLIHHAEHDTQHTRGVLRNMLKAGIVIRTRAPPHNAFAYAV